jgi:hypothetical protein
MIKNSQLLLIFFLLISVWVPSSAYANHGTPLSIPDNTWEVRVPPLPPNAPLGAHNSFKRGGGKHVNLTVSGTDHLIYVQGGDAAAPTLSNGKSPSTSDRQEVFTYDVKNDVWSLVHPYCAAPGQVAPAWPDFAPWIWDSTRNKFWYFGGGNQCEAQTCPLTHIRDVVCGGISDGTTVYTDRLNHWYNTTTHQYETPSINGHDSTNIQEILGRTLSNLLTDGIYDPIQDNFWLPIGGCNGRVCIYRYDPSADTDSSNIATSGWTKFEWSVSGNSDEFDAYNTRVTWDPTRRNMYLVSYGRSSAFMVDHLLRFNIDTQTFTDLGKLPGPVANLTDEIMIYNHAEDVLMFPQFDESEWSTMQLYIYHLAGPFAGQWEGVDMTTPPGEVEVHGRHWVYDKYNNVLVGTAGQDDYLPRIYLYRYKTPESLHPFDTVLPGNWYRVNNTHALDRRPDITNAAVDPHGGCVGNAAHPNGMCGTKGPLAVTDHWGGMAFDYKRSYIYLWGGGHGDYAGNEVYRLDLNLIDGVQATNPWVLDRDMDIPYHASQTELPDQGEEVRLKPCAGPASGFFIATNCFPGSVHSYDQMEYIGRTFDYVCQFINSAARNAANSSILSFCYDQTLKQWHRLPDYFPGARGAQSITGYDRFHHKLILKAAEGGFVLGEFNPYHLQVPNAPWVKLSKTSGSPADENLFPGYIGVMAQWETQGANEFVRFIAIGRDDTIGYDSDTKTPGAPFAFGTPNIKFYDLGLNNGDEVPTELSPTGDLEVFNGSKNLGATFDALINQVVMWNGGCDIYTMDPQSFVITRQVPTAGNLECPGPATRQGVLSRFRYLPRWGGYLLVNTMNDDVWFYKSDVTIGGGLTSLNIPPNPNPTPSPDTIPPGPPTEVTVQ